MISKNEQDYRKWPLRRYIPLVFSRNWTKLRPNSDIRYRRIENIGVMGGRAVFSDDLRSISDDLKAVFDDLRSISDDLNAAYDDLTLTDDGLS